MSLPRALLSLALTALVLGGVSLGVLAWRSPGAWSPPSADGLAPVDVDADRAAEALAELVRLPTVTPVEPGQPDWRDPPSEEQSPAWIAWIRERWIDPLGLRSERVGRGLAIFVDAPDDRAPILLLSHVDVVPVSDLDRWTHPPFDGVVADGIVYGRGTLDNKGSIVAQLEAIRLLLEGGGRPSRDVVLLITPDEEVGGETAQLAASDLARLGHPAAVLDEGSYLLPDLFPGALVAAVAVSEKTFVNYTLQARGEDRHSSMPQPPSAVDHLALALHRVGTWDTPSALPAPLVEGLRRVAPTRPFPESLVLGNADWLGPLVKPLVQRSPAGNAITRDTVATTLVRAGVKDNVIPAHAQANVNARLRPETSPEAFLEQLQARVGPDVEVSLGGTWERSGPGRWDTDLFEAIERVVPLVAPDAVVIPSVTPGTMDARYFAAAGLPTYRFHPFIAGEALRASIHGTDERLPVAELARGVQFYHLLLQAL